MKKITLLFLLLTMCTGLTYAQYLTEGFEGGATIPTGWTLGQTNANETWYIGNNAPQANTGTNYAIVEYDAALGNQDESLATPAIDLTSATNPRLIFWWNASYFWAVDPNDNYDFTVSVDNGSTVTQVFTETDESDFDSSDDNFVWFQRTVDLSAYVGQTITVIFNYSGADGASLTIDDVLIEETPSCEAPTGVTANTTSTTEATISWNAGGSETEWTYEYGVDGFTQGTGTSATVTMTSVDLTGLTPGETYDFYVQANCAANGDSTWVQTSFTMPVPPPANDLIGGAIPITPSPQGTGCGTAQFTLNFSTDGTTDSGLDGSCNGTDTGLDQFFTWTATTEGLLWNDAAPGNPGIVIRDSAGNEITCSGTFADDDIILSGWNIGEDLIIQIYDFGGSVSDVAFCLEEYTPPAPIVPNYSETFDSYPPADWSEATGPYGSPSGASSEWTGSNFGNDAGSANGMAADINIYGTGRDEYMISPRFNLSGGTYYLNFDVALTVWGETTASSLGADDYVAFLVTQDGGANWTELMRWDSSSTISNEGQSIPEIVLNGYGAEVQFAFYAFSDTSNADNDFFVDNFQITDATLSIRNDVLEGFKLYPTITNRDLHFSAKNKVDEISIFNMLGQRVSYLRPNVSSSSIDVSSLKSGVYIVRVSSQGANGVYRIIKE